MAMLVLIDLDNGVIRRDFAGLALGDAPAPVIDPDVIVAVGLNTATVLGIGGPGFSEIADITRRISSLFVVARSNVAVEIALTLTTPAAVDTVLFRLLHQAPDERHAVLVDRVVLASLDDGLRRLVGELLTREHGFVDADGDPGVRLRARAWEHGELRRKRPLRSHPPEAIAPDARWSTPITRSEHAVWATKHAPPLPPRLSDIARHLDGLPGDLSRVGATRSSVRGIARLLDGTVPVDARDEVELHLQHSVPTDPLVVYDAPSAATIGSGAVHLPLHRATVRTHLPLVVVRAGWAPARMRWRAGGTCLPCTARVDDRAILAAAPHGRLLGPVARIAITARFDPARVEFSSGIVDPEVWWFGGGSAMCTVAVAKPTRVHGGPLVVDARMVVVRAEREDQVWMANAHERWPFDVAVGSAVPGGTLVKARAGRVFVALLTLAHSRRGTFPCVPIQAVSPVASALRGVDPHLWTVPVVVPLDEVSEDLVDGRLHVQEDA